VLQEGQSFQDTISITATDSAGHSLGATHNETININSSAFDVVYFPLQPSWTLTNPNFPWGVCGEVTWTITSTKLNATFTSSTFLEIYGLTEELAPYWSGQIDVRFLRTFVLPAQPSSAANTWLQYVPYAVFNSFGMKYEISGGWPRYAGGSNGGNFDLSRWTRSAVTKREAKINCYDTAGLCQIALGLGDVHADWIFLEPYGFLRSTKLIGYPEFDCNSPYMTKTTTETNWYWRPNTDPDRQMFKNHAFLRVNGSNYLDACSGPALGTQTIADHITKDIQTCTASSSVVLPATSSSLTDDTSLYWLPKNQEKAAKKRPANLTDLASTTIVKNGIWAIDECPITLKDPTDGYYKSVLAAVTAAEQNYDNAITYSKNCFDIRGLISEVASLVSKAEATVSDYYCAANKSGYTLSWDIQTPGVKSDVDLDVHVFADHTSAKKWFQLLLQYQMTRSDILTKVAVGGISTQPSLQSSRAGHGWVLWVHGNVVINITGDTDSASLLSQFAQPLDDWFVLNVYDPTNLFEFFPPTTQIITEGPITAGSQFDVRVSVCFPSRYGILAQFGQYC
jgi:hypothetical protein